MPRLKVSERVRRINIVGNLVGVKYKNPTKLVGKRFRSLNRIYLLSKKYEDSNFEFVPILGDSARDLNLKKRIVRGTFEQSIPKRVKGVWIPLRVSGPFPQLDFNLSERTLSVSGPNVPATDFIPISRRIAFEEFQSDGVEKTALSTILNRYPAGTQFIPTDKKGSSFKAGNAGDKGFIRQLLQNWISKYGWAQNRNSDFGPHDMGEWFTGLSIIHGGELNA